MSNYFDGAVMAYRDCADWAKHLKQNLPEEVRFMAPVMDQFAEAFNEKANNVIHMVNAAKNPNQ